MKTNWKIVLLVVVIVAFGAFLRVSELSSFPPGLYPDEAMNGSNGLEALYGTGPTSGFKVFYPENNGREGLFINIQALFLKMFVGENGTQEPWMLRVPSTLFGIFTILGVFFLSRELFWGATDEEKKRANRFALLSAFFIATSFWHINFSRIGFRAIMAPFFLVWGTYFFLWAIRVFKNPIKKSVWLIPIFGGIMYGLGFHSYIAYRATPLLFIILVIWLLLKKYPRKQLLKVTSVFVVFAFLTVLPLVTFFLENPQDFFGRTAQISVFQSSTLLKDLSLNILKTIGMFNVSGDWNWRHNIAGAPLLAWPVGICFLIGIAIGIKNGFQFLKLKISKNINTLENNTSYLNTAFFVSFAWLFSVSAPVVISNEGIPHALRAILMIPTIFIIAGIGGVFLYKFVKNLLETRGTFAKKSLQIVGMFLLFFIAFDVWRNYFVRWGENPEVKNAFAYESVQIADQLNQLPKELPKYVIVEAKGTDVRGIPMPVQTIMFLTSTFLPEWQKERNIYYILPEEQSKIPQGSFVVTIK